MSSIIPIKFSKILLLNLGFYWNSNGNTSINFIPGSKRWPNNCMLLNLAAAKLNKNQVAIKLYNLNYHNLTNVFCIKFIRSNPNLIQNYNKSFNSWEILFKG